MFLRDWLKETPKHDFSSFLSTDAKETLQKSLDHYFIRNNQFDKSLTEGTMSRFFNDLNRQYIGILPLVKTLPEALEKNRLNEWLTLAMIVAHRELFDYQGNVLPDLLQVLNYKQIYISLIQQFGIDKVKLNILNSFVTEIISEEATKFCLEKIDQDFQLKQSDTKASVTPPSTNFYSKLADRLKTVTAVDAKSIESLYSVIVLDNKNVTSSLTGELRYVKACYDLESLLKNNKLEHTQNEAYLKLCQQAQKLLEVSDDTKHQKDQSNIDTNELTNAMIVTRKVIESPTKENIEMYRIFAEQLTKHPRLKQVGAAMLGVSGTLSVILGGGLAYAAGSLVPGVGIAFGIGAVVVGGILYFKNKTQREIEDNMVKVANEAENTYNYSAIVKKNQ